MNFYVATVYENRKSKRNISYQNFPANTYLSVSHNRNRKLQISKAPLKSQAQDTSLFTSAASNQRGFPKNNNPWEPQVRSLYGERMRRIRGVFQRVVRGKLRSGCQRVRGGRHGRPQDFFQGGAKTRG